MAGLFLANQYATFSKHGRRLSFWQSRHLQLRFRQWHGSIISIANATLVPSKNPTGAGVLNVKSGALKYRGSSGTITVLAPG